MKSVIEISTLLLQASKARSNISAKVLFTAKKKAILQQKHSLQQKKAIFQQKYNFTAKKKKRLYFSKSTLLHIKGYISAKMLFYSKTRGYISAKVLLYSEAIFKAIFQQKHIALLQHKKKKAIFQQKYSFTAKLHQIEKSETRMAATVHTQKPNRYLFVCFALFVVCLLFCFVLLAQRKQQYSWNTPLFEWRHRPPK